MDFGDIVNNLIDMNILGQIESSNNPSAYNKKSKARGLYQITPIVLKEWNNFNPKKTYAIDDLFDPNINKTVATWYLNNRIPQMLKAYKKPIDLGNVLTAYNAGIKYVKEGLPLPLETKNYINKYNKLLNKK